MRGKENEYRERKQKEADERKRENKIKRLEESILNIENEIAELEQKSFTDEYATNYTKAMEISNEISSKKDELNMLYSELEEYI